MVKEALRESKVLHDKGSACWYTCLAVILDKLGLSRFLSNPGSVSTQYLCHVVKDQLQQRYEKIWHRDINDDVRKTANQGNKLRCYRTFKYIFKKEQYLSLIENRVARKAFTKLRISNHNLAIEAGRHSGVEVSHRICQQCDSGAIEDECHFVMNCSRYKDVRINFLKGVSAQNKNVSILNDKNKFIWLMSNEDKSVCRALAHFIHSCSEFRSA